MIKRIASLLSLVAGLAAALVPAAEPQEFTAGANIRSSYTDTDMSATPPAQVAGDTSPGSVWIKYDVTTGDGFVDGWHQLYSCCVSQSGTTGRVFLEDLVFSTPGGSGGTATVSLNLWVEGDTDGSCNGGNLGLKVGINGGVQDQGYWDAGEPPCGSSLQSTGIFTGYNGDTIAGFFSISNLTVPLDTPVSFEVTATAGTGSYQQVSTMDTYVSFPEPAAGVPVFGLDNAPEGTTVNSEQGDITDNMWGGGYQVVGVGDHPAPPRFTMTPVSPNPSAGLASVDVHLPRESPVSGRVFNLNGRLVAEILDGTLPEGIHRLSWKAGGAVSSGIYFLRIRALGEEQSRRVILVR